MADFKQELESLINKHSIENESDTPDFVLANYIMMCLDAYNTTVRSREKWGKIATDNKIIGIKTNLNFGNYEPKYINRFRVDFSDNIGIENWKVKSISKPKKTNYTDTSWEDICIVLYDTIGPSTSQEVNTFIENFNKNKSLDIKFSFNIVALDPVGIEVETWFIDIEDINFVDYGNFDYENIKPENLNFTPCDKVSLITLNIKPKTCELLF